MTRIISSPYPNHSHEPADQQLKEKQFKEKVIEEQKKNPAQTMKTAYEKTIEKYNHEIIVPFNSVRSSFSRARKQLLPAIPHSIQTVQIPAEWAKTSSGKNSCFKMIRKMA